MSNIAVTDYKYGFSRPSAVILNLVQDLERILDQVENDK